MNNVWTLSLISILCFTCMSMSLARILHLSVHTTVLASAEDQAYGKIKGDSPEFVMFLFLVVIIGASGGLITALAVGWRLAHGPF